MQDAKDRARAIIKTLRGAVQGMQLPAAALIVDEYGRNPYLVLISCILSLRTKDLVSWPASRRLFSCARTPEQMIKLSVARIEKLIYPVGFYRQKAAQIKALSADLLARFGGAVPANEHDLLSLKGVGRKTANLVLGEGFGIPAICVDVHVHRISNRLGLVSTQTVEETERALQEIVPRELWVEYNRLLVMWGQNVCVPQSPWCSRCPLFDLCARKGVVRSR